MKKIVYSLILFMMFMGVTNAAKCNVIKGTGENIGDEIACGTERFYVLENNGEIIKMLSKYNLFAGYIQDKVTISENDVSTNQDLYTHPKLKDKFKNGYEINEFIFSPTSDDVTISLRKMLYLENKDIFFDKKTMTLHEYLNRSDVQKQFEEGYYFEFYTGVHYNVQNCQDNQACTYEWFGGDFSKSKYYDVKVIVFDEPFSCTSSELEARLENNTEYKKLKSEGYSIFKEYKDVYKKASNEKDNINLYSGIGMKKIYDNYKDKVYQDETAKGLIGDENRNVNTEEIAIIPSIDIFNKTIPDDEKEIYSKYFYDYEYSDYNYEELYTIIFTTSYYYELYQKNLKEEGYNVIEAKALTMSELNDLTKKITSKEIPLDKWFENAEYQDNLSKTELEKNPIHFGSIKELLPQEYNWLWETTYWLRSKDDNKNTYVVNTMGDLCTYSCCTNLYGAGIRPTITILSNDIIYNVKTKTDGNGTIEININEAEKGEYIKFSTTSKEGYILDTLKVTDENGNIIVFKDNNFTMPNTNVIIEAKFKKITSDNPDTSDLAIIFCILIIISGIALMYTNIKKMHELI